MTILWIILGFLVLTNIGTGFMLWNLYKKYEYSDAQHTFKDQWIKEFNRRLRYIDIQLKTIDLRGSFESDDEVGTIYQNIKELMVLITELGKFIDVEPEGGVEVKEVVESEVGTT